MSLLSISELISGLLSKYIIFVLSLSLQEIMKRSLLIFHMDDFQVEELESHFNKFGKVESVKVFERGKRKYARIIFETYNGAEAAYSAGKIEDHMKYGKITKQSMHKIGSGDGFVVARRNWKEAVEGVRKYNLKVPDIHNISPNFFQTHFRFFIPKV